MSGPVHGWLRTTDLGRISYEDAYALQLEHVALAQAARETPDDSLGRAGALLLLEHDPPVITISRRPDARSHLLATDEMLARHGVTVRETDRGGDITYHGPGQLVAYPIVDLNAAHLNLHGYMRLLERVVINVCASFGIEDAHRDHCATGVWVGGSPPAEGEACDASNGAKICAMGVRVKRWVAMHGIALNVSTNLDHFNLIVPCGLPGRPVTSMAKQLGDRCPSMDEVKRAFASELDRAIEEHASGGGVTPDSGRRARRS